MHVIEITLDCAIVSAVLIPP